MYTPVTQRNTATKTGYVPVSQRQTSPTVAKSPLKIISTPKSTKVGVTDVLREIPNTLKRAVGVVRDFTLPTRGYTEKELAGAQNDVSFQQRLASVPKLGAEILSGTAALGDLFIDIAGLRGTVASKERFSETSVGKKLAEYARPKNVEEAAALRLADIVSFIPAGTMRIEMKTAQKIALLKDAGGIAKLLKAEVKGLTDEGAETLGRLLVPVENADDVQKVINRTDFALNGTRGDTRAITKAQGLPDLPKIAPAQADPLISEARKYKSAEEFVKARGEVDIPDDIRAKLPSVKAQNAYDEAESNVFTSLELSEAGSRSFVPEIGKGQGGGTYNIKTIPSTFPKRVPEELRSKELFDLVSKRIQNGQPLTGSRQKALADVIAREIADSIPMELRDELALIDIAKEDLARLASEDLTARDAIRLRARQILKDMPTQKTTAGVQTKRVIKETLEPSPKKITKTEPQLLKTKLKEQAKGAKAGFKAGKTVAREEILTKLRHSTQVTQGIKNDIVQFAKESLGTENRGKALTLVRDAKTPRDLVKAFSRINRWAEDAIKVGIKNDILKTQKSLMDSPSIAIDYKARVKELMGDFELKGHREETLERLKKTQEFLQSELARGNDIEIPRRVLKSLDLLNRTPFDEITVNQLKGLQAEMELLGELGRTKFRTTESIWEIQKTKILDEVAAQGTKPIKDIELLKPEIGERLTASDKFKNFVWSAGNKAAQIDRALSPMDAVFDLLDGGKASYDGANFRFFKGQVDAGYGRYITRKDALQNPVVEMASKHGLDDTNFERMGVVAARDQDGGMEKLIASGFTEDKVNAIKLTPEEQEVLDLMRKTFDSQFPEIQDTMRRVYNQPVEKVKNYFSFMTDWKAMDESEVFQRFGSQSPDQFGAPKKNTEAGFAKSRVGGDQKIKINALDVFLQHTDNTSYLLELGETTKMLGEVAASPKYAEAVGDVGQLMVREWVDVVARKGGAAGAQEIALLNILRKNVGIGILGLKLSTIAIQPTSLIDGMGFIGAKYGMKGVTNFTTSADWRKFVGNMPEISDRLGGEFALRELTDNTWIQEIQRKGFIPLQKLDQMTAGAVAAGAYERKMVELGRAIDLTTYDPEALAYAQLAVRRTQSSGAFKDVPLAVSRGALTGNRSVDRAILQFQNFLLSRWSRIRHDAIRAGINTKDPKKAIPILTAVIMSALAASGIRLGVNKVQDLLTGREDEDTASEDFTKSFGYELTGNVPFLGTIIGMATYDSNFMPILDVPQNVIEGLDRVVNSKSEGAKLRGLTQAISSIGTLAGLPGSAQAGQLVGGALQEEKKSSGGGGLPQLPKLPSLPKLPKLPSF